MSVFAPPISDQLLLDALVKEPDCLETGLRLLETHQTSHKKACVASGFDRSDRPVVLYVKDIVIDVDDVKAALACRTRSDVETSGRVIVLATGFHDDWNCNPPTLPGGWELESLRWHIRNEMVDGEMVVEISEGEEPDLRKKSYVDGHIDTVELWIKDWKVRFHEDKVHLDICLGETAEDRTQTMLRGLHSGIPVGLVPHVKAKVVKEEKDAVQGEVEEGEEVQAEDQQEGEDGVLDNA